MNVPRLTNSLFFLSIKSTLYSKKYGVTLARFTHHKNNVIYASTKEDGNFVTNFCDKTMSDTLLIDTLRYLSVYDNKYIRYFRGHKKRLLLYAMEYNLGNVLTLTFIELLLWRCHLLMTHC